MVTMDEEDSHLSKLIFKLQSFVGKARYIAVLFDRVLKSTPFIVMVSKDTKDAILAELTDLCIN